MCDKILNRRQGSECRWNGPVGTPVIKRTVWVEVVFLVYQKAVLFIASDTNLTSEYYHV